MKPLLIFPQNTFRLIAFVLFLCLCQLNLKAQPNAILKFYNIIGDKIYLFKGYPDTLKMGEFTIYVEEYDKGGRYDALSKTYRGLSGIGRIRFTCQRRFPFFDVLLKDAVLKPYSVSIVDTIKNPQTEISPRDAVILGIKAQVNSTVEIMLPHYGSKAADLSRYLNDVAAVKRPEGIRVRFKNLTVGVLKPGATVGTVVEGIATYPSDPPIPTPPFELNIAPGFILQVDSLAVFPNRPTKAIARLVLPNSLTAGEACRAATLGLGVIQLSARCEFYKELLDSTYGTFGVGATTLAIAGRGYVADFSSLRQYIPSGKPLAWKGVALLNGQSKGSPSGTVVSNIGYLQGSYSFALGLVQNTGLLASFNSSGLYRYTSSQPLGYNISFNTALVHVSASAVTGGFVRNGVIDLPRTAVRQANDATVTLDRYDMTIHPSMNLTGVGSFPDATNIYWGDLVKAGGGELKSFGIHNISARALLFFSAQPREQFFPLNSSGTTFNPLPTIFSHAAMESYGMQGALFMNPNYLVVNSPDVKAAWDPNKSNPSPTANPIWFQIKGGNLMWLNVATEGVNCQINSTTWEARQMELGDPSKPLYVGKKPFDVKIDFENKKGSILLQCVESAVFSCDFRAFITLAEPIKSVMGFKEMVFTSTAQNAGGKLLLGGGQDSLDYWGLKLVQKPGFTNAGLVSVKTGQIVITAAGLSEPRHFSQPFWLTWGEILANGEVGRLFFDFNSAGQQFDGFNYVHNAVALSPYVAGDKAFLRVGGTAYFPFFGSDYLHIQDFYDPSVPAAPFNKRRVELNDSSTPPGFFATDRDIGGNWSDGLGVFNFKIKYNEAGQDGFIGDGTSLLRYLIGGNIASTLDLNSRGTCIRIGSDLLDQRGLALGPVANITNITRIWGCVCIKNDGIGNMVVGGEVTNAANVSIAARVGSHLSMVMQVTPSLVKVTFDGIATLSLAAALDALVSGHVQLTLNHAEGFIEGEVRGKIRAAEGALFVGSSIEAEGQLNWHLGINFHELQGMVSLKVMNFGGGSELGAGFYIGKNAPKSRAWVLIGGDPRFNLNMTPMPDRLTGLYGTVHIKQGINLYVVSGEYELHVGLGAFLLTPAIATQVGGITPTIGLPYIVGNLGGRIHGEILGGLVSAGAYFNLQIIGPYPFSFEGTVGLEGCVVWVVCGSVDITVGLNTTEGFYVR